MSKKTKQFILLFGDLVILYLSLYLTLFFRYGHNYHFSVWQNHFLPFTIVYIVWLIIFYINDLYELKSTRLDAIFFTTLFRAILINLLIAVVFFYFIPYFNVTPKRNLFLNIFIFTLLFIFWRFLYTHLIFRFQLPNNLLLIGLDKISFELGKKIIKNPFLGYQLKAVIATEEVENLPWQNVKFAQNLKDLEKIIKEEKINTVVVRNDIYYQMGKELYQLLIFGIDIFNLPTFWEKIAQSIPISATEETWFLENLRGKQKRGYEIIKRGIDVFLSIFFGLISLIFYPLIILAIKLDSPGPAFYQQKRVGKNNKIFKIIKFRTMITEAEKNGPQWAKENDSRITKVGKLLRRFHLDELPQLLNILKGEMSFIGPRPERPEFVEELVKKIPHYHLRHLIKPGLTGWAQINYPYGSSVEDTEKKLYYDLYYLKNRSLILDLEIFLKTLANSFSPKEK